MHIIATMDDVADLDDRLQRQATDHRNTMTVYTDGSGIDCKIGAAIYNASTNETAHQHLGDETRYNVYAAELRYTSLIIDAGGRISKILAPSS
jgi:hypothetical protein